MPTSIENIINDEKLHVLFKSIDTHCAVQLWLLQIEKKGNIETQLLYGRILPYSFSNDQWSAPNEDNFKQFNGYKAQVIRINLYCGTCKLGDLVSALSFGKNILHINNDLNFSMTKALQQRFGEFCFTGKLGYRPVSYLPMRDHFDHHGLKSPHSSAGAFSGAIIPFDKNLLFFNHCKTDKTLLSYAIDSINSDTGMSFDKDDIGRLGDLEFLVFPTLDNHERNLLKVDWKEKGKMLNVLLEQGKHNQYDIFYIKTNFTNDHQIVHSILKTVQVSDDCVFADVEVPDYLNEMIDGLHVEIHAQKNDDITATLYCQYGVGLVREMNISVNLVSPVSGAVKSDWMTKVTKLPANHDRIIKVQAINQGSASSSSVVGGRQADPWVSINRNNKTLLKKLQPAPSEGRFFERYKDGDGLGRLEFVEWLKNLLNSHQKHQIIVFDPYFEDVGISLLIPNASHDSNFIIFTTTESQTEQQRLNNIISCCEQLSLWVKRIQLRVFGLANGAFHDRYILISEKNGESLKGYHLSNSIQKANENYPLLITPIPPDVLVKVNDYALDVLRRESHTQFFDSKNMDDKQSTRHRFESLSFLNENEAGTVLGALTGVQELNGLSSEALKTKLKQFGFLQGESLNGEKFAEFKNILSVLSQIDGTTFDKYWNVTGHILANTPSGNLIGFSCENSDITILCKLLLIYINSKASGETVEAYDAHDAFGYCQQLHASINQVLNYGNPAHFHHGIKFKALSWADYYAIKILWRCNPYSLLDFLEDAMKLISSEGNYDRNKLKIYSILAQIINEIALNVEFGLTEVKITLLINRNNDFLKWFGYSALETAIVKNNRLLSKITDMPKPERIMLLGWMINRTSEKDTELNPLFEKLVSEYLSSFPSVLVSDDITVCIDSLRGHMRNLGWCEPWLFNQIVAPLIDSGRVNFDDLAMIWINELNSLFENILSGHSAIFKVNNEGRTTDIAAYLISRSGFKCQELTLTLLNKILKDISRDIQKPLASACNWERWDSSLKIAFWVFGLTKWVHYHLPLPNLIEPKLMDVLNYADKLRSYRLGSEWKALDYLGDGFSVFFKDRDEL
jgi:hypothetical protein